MKTIFMRWKLAFRFAAIAIIGSAFIGQAVARDINYSGSEIIVYVIPNEPSQVTFPSNIISRYYSRGSSFPKCAIEVQGNFLVIFAPPELPPEGQAKRIVLDNQRIYTLRFILADDKHVRDEFVKIIDKRVNSD